MTDAELTQKRDEMARFHDQGDDICGFDFKIGFDAAVKLMRAERSAYLISIELDALKDAFNIQKVEIDRLTRVIAKELTENDELGSEFVYVNALKAETKDLSIKLQRTVSAAYHALLEMSAWMGIPEDKRHERIKYLMENVKYCAEHDLRHIDEHQATARWRECAERLAEAVSRSRGQWIHSVNAEICLSASAQFEELKAGK